MSGDPYDILVIGGGVNGAGIARDAAGRGLSVLLAEKGDLAAGTSSRSSKLVHGGLRYLERYEFRLVREALSEREVLLRAAPHIVWPLRFVLPHVAEMRPEWMIRLGLLLYDHLSGRRLLAASSRLDLRTAPEGGALKSGFRTGFVYSDCWVEDARLVVSNALDASRKGAEIRLHTEAIAAHREARAWRVRLAAPDGTSEEVAARVLVNAAGPWVEQVLHRIAGASERARVRLVKGSHLVLSRHWEGEHAYILQHLDRRVVFLIPFERSLTLLGTTDEPYEGPPEAVAITDAERRYLLTAANRYLRRPLKDADILYEYSGVRPLFDDQAADPSAVTRDYVLMLDAPGGAPPLLSVFGGKITTHRRLAEHVLERVQRFFPHLGPAFTRSEALPGGDMPDANFSAFADALATRFSFLPPPLLNHYARLYGTRALSLLEGANAVADLGRHFGALLYEREADFLVRTEWARSAEDILFRRTRHHLHLSAAEQGEFARWMR